MGHSHRCANAVDGSDRLGASKIAKIAGRPGLALGGRGLVPGPAFVVRGTSRSDGRVRANQEVSLRIIIK